MSTPLGADALLRALRAEDADVTEYRDWRTHNRNHKGSWGPVEGVMIHHTVTSGTPGTLELVYNGHSDLPGPLAHGVIAKDGRVYMTGNGRANHAGKGDAAVLRAVKDGLRLPSPQNDSVDGNALFYGFECINLGDGNDPWPVGQLDAIIRTASAICRTHGWSERRVIGHLEWTRRKIDPRGFSMGWLRNQVAQRLAHSADWDGETMTLSKEDAITLFGADGTVKNGGPTADSNPTLSAGTSLYVNEVVTRRIEAKIDDLSAKVDMLLNAGGLTAEQIAAIAAIGGEAGAKTFADRLGGCLQTGE